ncbi:DUF397 domain-containing protein [Streptomyces sp. NBC_01381]|uniref:DUF397 domain-containing protein n=1 Tax=Streptomyces sp. NBC_01381 TaxID=2903845 RepID=UPI0022561BED|nr:DUF397 domain-containing protein [Streptomyces sp. NBC_01381]MCX4666894.1 DUF397 domain-containing protein [Streptomyces sp. NBC_01381]
MDTHNWQKSTYSGDASNCVYIAATPDGTLRLRESDTPDIILTTTPNPLHALIRTLKGGAARRGRR